MLFKSLFTFLLVALIFSIGCEAAKCTCLDSENEVIETCCNGVHAEEWPQEEGKSYCRFVDFSLFASFNRCCDSFDGKAVCYLELPTGEEEA